MMKDVLFAILETFLLMGAGALALRLKMIEAAEISRLSRLALDFFMPLLTISVISKTFSPAKITEFWIMPLMGFAMMFLGALIGFVLKRLMHDKSPERMATFHHICAINNYVFLPLIILLNIFGNDTHVALLLVMNVGSTIGFWTLGIITLTGVNRSALKDSLKKILSVNVIAVFVALLLACLPFQLPKPLANVCDTLGGMAVPFTIMLTGAALYHGSKGLLRYKRDMIYLTAVRLLLIPLIFIAILKLLPLPADVYETCFVVALMPAAVSSVLVARLNGGSDEMAAQSILVTTILSLLSIPLLMTFM